MKLGEQCLHCDMVATEQVGWNCGEQAVDPCLGVLPGVKYACCGHGGLSDSLVPYVAFDNGVTLHFDLASVNNEGEEVWEDVEKRNAIIRANKWLRRNHD